MLKKLMHALYYPAVLGTGFVLILNKISVQRQLWVSLKDVTNYFGMLLIGFFSIAYLVNDSITEDSYTSKLFFLDVAQVVLMFLGFLYLGFLQPDKPNQISLSGFYFTLSISPWLQQLWNIALGFLDRRILLLRAGASAMLVAGGLSAWKSDVFNIVAIIVLGGELAVTAPIFFGSRRDITG
jgi:hypothetical protein